LLNKGKTCHLAACVRHGKHDLLFRERTQIPHRIQPLPIEVGTVFALSHILTVIFIGAVCRRQTAKLPGKARQQLPVIFDTGWSFVFGETLPYPIMPGSGRLAQRFARGGGIDDNFIAKRRLLPTCG
jgi:hypothetical protein